jgi:hypothetical protein
VSNQLASATIFVYQRVKKKDLFLGALERYQAVYQFSLAIRPTMAIIICYWKSGAGGKLTSGGPEKQ